jgi:hypothetical protein
MLKLGFMIFTTGKLSITVTSSEFPTSTCVYFKGSFIWFFPPVFDEVKIAKCI